MNFVEISTIIEGEITDVIEKSIWSAWHIKNDSKGNFASVLIETIFIKS